MPNEVVLVDIFDNPLGVCEKLKAHMEKKLHRAFSLFIYSGDCILLQQRAYGKYHSGGKWANSCCSHPTIDEEITACVVDRTREDLGIDIDTPTKLFDFIYYSEYDNGLTEYELDNVFVVKFDGRVDNFNHEEVNAVEWVNIDDLAKDLVNNPTKYSTWFLNCAPRVIQYLKKN